MGIAATEADDAARGGARHGSVFTCDEGGKLEVALVLRPPIGMRDVSGLPYVVALGACEGLDALGAEGVGIGWPADIVDDRGIVATVRTSAGYEQGIFVIASLALDLARLGVESGGEDPADVLSKHILARVDSWGAAAEAGRTAAGPLAPLLSDYFDRVPLMGRPVDLVYPNGKVAATKTLAGIDVWGRASLKNDCGCEMSISPAEFLVRPHE